MTIGVCGYGYSGSGAVLDFLREWNELSCVLVKTEFDIAYLPHGLQDLEYQLMERKTRFLSSNAALKDFKRLICGLDRPRGEYRKLTGKAFRERSFKLIEELSQLTWHGKTIIDSYREGVLYRRLNGRICDLIKIYEHLTGKKWKFFKSDILYLSVAPDNFYTIVTQYLRDILEMLGYDIGGSVLLNQPFDVYDPKRSMKYFDNPKAIIVDRDPRDIYVLAKYYVKSAGSFIPTDSVEDYIRYHRLVRNKNLEADENIICMRYEDMIYNYDRTAGMLTDFLGLAKARQNTGAHYNPDISINNTQLYRLHPECADDILRIEESLPEYIYPFERFECKPLGDELPF